VRGAWDLLADALNVASPTLARDFIETIALLGD